VDLKSLPSLKSFVLPGGLFLLATAIVVRSGLVSLSGPATDSFYAACFGAGLVLAWRFHSSRVATALLTLWLAERALIFFSAGHSLTIPPGRVAFFLISVLLPVNFAILTFWEERGFAVPALGSRFLLLFVESVFVATLCRPDANSDNKLLNLALVDRHWVAWTRIPQIALLAFVIVLVVMAFRFLSRGKPVESGFFWALLATALALQSGAVGKVATTYLATAALILLASVIETSYLMAYHDELTGVPARRAFNEALRALESPYAIAVVDIDHFKKFNDTYGHETGDHVLRLVAARLARVTGGGRTYRCGGEEFSIIFSGVSAKEATPHLEELRATIERSRFKVRSPMDRRSSPRGPDRRRTAAKKKKSRPADPGCQDVTVTVSMGVAEPATQEEEVSQVIRRADQALYRAKEGGRNRVEITANESRRRVKRAALDGAS
jgi:diguanylate cyclase (GGDEF)-like protein